MKPLTRFEESVLGAVGRTVGERCPEHPASIGEPVPAVADLLEEGDGTGFVIQLEGELPELDRARVTICGENGEPIEARAPFADASGHFALEVGVDGERIAFFVAYGALVDPPEQATVTVALRSADGTGIGHTAFALRPGPAVPIEFATYARPFAGLAWAIAMADGRLDPAEQEHIGLQLKTLLGGQDAAVEGLAEPPPEAPRVSALAVSLRCRFSELDSEELFFALLGVAASDGEVSDAEVQVLRKVARRLDVPDRAWQRWAFRMGVELPEPESSDVTDIALDQAPPLVVLAERHGRRVPSIILRLDRVGQDRRNVFATLSLLTGVLAVAVWFVSVGLVLAPLNVAAVGVPLVGGVQLLVAALAVALGSLGLRVARQTGGAGHGAATSGFALGMVALMLGFVWWLVVCLGLSATAYWDQQET